MIKCLQEELLFVKKETTSVGKQIRSKIKFFQESLKENLPEEIANENAVEDAQLVEGSKETIFEMKPGHIIIKIPC